MKFSKIKSYAKINLSLNVNGKLSSQYHKIESLVSFVDFHDIIYVRRIKFKKHKINFKGKFSKRICKKNTVSNLLNVLDAQGLLNNKKFEIKIKKNIPQESGMGGGSMNAASLINFFVKKKLLKLNQKKLINLTSYIGSDVILGVDPKNTVLSANGKLTRFKKKIKYYVLITKPNFGCSTKKIYSKVKYFSKSKYSTPKQSLFSKINLIKSNNVLEQVAFKEYPRLKKLKSFLTDLPNVIFVRMTGSGSSIVAYFHSKKDCDNATKQFKRNFYNYWCITSKTI
tara:strand:+ start:563 stop:1411 length:849 start_codon:yes stop_codon:yes gene_type:complete